jgi:hypothetical protein
VHACHRSRIAKVQALQALGHDDRCRGDDLASQTASVWSINPLSGTVRHVGELPDALSDAGVASVDGGLVVAGGPSPAGTQAGVGELISSRPAGR